jgi:putative tricarboxylic transport membrane protein
MLAFGIAGYALHKIGCEAAPLILGFVLGPLMEENFRRSMLISRGDPMIFLERPISLAFLIAGALLLAIALNSAFGRRRNEIFVDED